MRATCLTICAIVLVAPSGNAEQARVPVVADTSLQAHPQEVTFNSGASSSIRIKGNEHFMLMKFDLRPVRDWQVDGATLHVHQTRETMLRTVGLSTIAADWEEGTGRSARVDGGCTFTRAVWPDAYWAGPRSEFIDVSLTNGNTLAHYANVRPEDGGWLAIDVPPALVYAMLCGDSYGLCLSDEKGQTRANNDVHSREQSSFAPYLIVDGEPQADAGEVGRCAVTSQPWPSAADFERGAVRLTVTSPGPDAFRYEIMLRSASGGQAQAVPRYVIPHPGEAGRKQYVAISGLAAEADYLFSVAAVDRWGNVGAPATCRARACAAKPLPARLATIGRMQRQGAEPPIVDGLRVWALPAECKVSPISGNVLEEVGPGRYEGPGSCAWRRRNALWNGRQATLWAARGEVVALQVVVENLDEAPCTVRLRCRAAPGDPEPLLPSVFSRNWYVKDKQWYAEYMAPIVGGEAIIPATDNAVPGQRNQAFTLIWEVPRDARPGTKRCEVKVTSAEAQALPVNLAIEDLQLPVATSFEVDLNCYGPVHSDADFDEYLQVERRYYAAAHMLRATINPLPYSQSGSTYGGFVPELEGSGAQMRVASWDRYDRHYGPYLDGSAFSGIRAGEPITHMYLPFHESWPTPIRGHYSAANDIRKYIDNIIHHALTAPAIEVAFDREFKDAFVAVMRQFVEHLAQRGWTQTEMQCYQNNKYYFKDEQHGFRGTSWWLLDEPMHRDDFLALRFFARMMREGTGDVRNFAYRGDISRPQWQRDWLDGLVDTVCVSSALFSHQGHCGRMRDQWGATFWHYGTANPVRESNLSGEAWALKAYLGGADGILPWNCIGGDGAYTKPTPTALFVPGDRFGIKGPILSLRLLGLCRGQQDVEYLNLLARKHGYDRDQIAFVVSDLLELSGEHRVAYAEDAGTLQFGGLSWEQFASLRQAVAKALSGAEGR